MRTGGYGRMVKRVAQPPWRCQERLVMGLPGLPAAVIVREKDEFPAIA
jgi:hypothetical protein